MRLSYLNQSTDFQSKSCVAGFYIMGTLVSNMQNYCYRLRFHKEISNISIYWKSFSALFYIISFSKMYDAMYLYEQEF